MHYPVLLMGLAATQAAAGLLPLPFQGNNTSTMPNNSTATSTATASAAIGTDTSVPKGPHQVTAHPDGQCRHSMNTTNSMTFKINDGFPGATTIKAPEFPGAESKTGSGYDVWWSMPDPGQGCRNIIMLPYNQARGTPGHAAGKEIINSGHAGCFPGAIPGGSDVLLTFCCGRDNCNDTSLGSASLQAGPTKRGVDLTVEPTEQHERQEDTAPVQHSGSIAGRALSLNERFYLPPPPKDPGCNFKAGQPFSQAGPQTIVSPAQRCTVEGCKFDISYEMTYATTATSETSQTITNSIGVSVEVTAGVDFLGGGASISSTLSTEFSNALEKSTGTEIQKTNSTTITNEIAGVIGAMGAASFTPIYQCWSGPMDCGKGNSDPLHFCQPDKTILGVLKGEYDVVVYG